MADVLTIDSYSADNYRDVVVPITSGGVPQDLTGCSVVLELKNVLTGTVLNTGTVVDAPATAGIVRRAWADVAEVTTDVRFRYRVRVIVTFPNGKKQTFPEPSQPKLSITIVPREP